MLSFHRLPGFSHMLSPESMLLAAGLAVGGMLLLGWFMIVPRLRRKQRRNLVRQKPSLDFSLTGLVYCSMMMFMGLAAINSQANLLFGVFGLMVGILLISGVVSRKVMRRLEVRRVLPDHGAVGLPSTLIYQVTNAKKFWPSLSVTVAELDGVDGFTRQPQAYMLHAAPGATASVPVEVVPRRRGLHTLDRFQICSSFPFGFIKRATTEARRDVLLAYPPLAQVDRRVLTLCRAAEKTGSSLRPRKGGSDEFYGVKEFRPGDNPRWIYWRRSAHTAATGVLVAKEMTHVAPPRLMLLVDTFFPDKGTNGTVAEASIERTIAMAASLATAALDQELTVGLLAWSDGWKTLEPRRGKRHRNDVLSILARLTENRSHNAASLLQEARTMLHSGATAVLFTPTVQPVPRDGTLTLSPASPETAAWFRFDPSIDFAACAPQNDVAD
jgi:uncharacterized protein (DUF58 family)